MQGRHAGLAPAALFVVLPGTEEETAIEVAERCRQALSATPVQVPGRASVRVTASFGVAALVAGDGPDQEVAAVVRRTDRALHAAKARGRDRVVVADREELLTGPLGVDEGTVAPLLALADRVDALLSPCEHSAAMARWPGWSPTP